MLKVSNSQRLEKSPDGVDYVEFAGGAYQEGAWLGRLDVRSVLAFLRRRFKAIMIVGLLCLAPILYYVVSIPSEYAAVAYVLLDPQQALVMDTDRSVPSVAGDESAVATEVELVKAQPVALSVADRLMKSDLWAEVSEVEAPKPDQGAAPPPSPEEERAALTEALAGGLLVSRVRQSHLIAISFTAPDPKLAAFVANAFAEAYLDDQLNAKFNSMQRANEWLDARVEDLRSSVLAAERASEEHRLKSQPLTDLRAKSDADLVQRELEREVLAKRTLLESFLARAAEINQQKTLQLPESRIVTRATETDAPAGPNRAALGLAGILFSLGFGVGLAILLEASDGTVRSGGQAAAALGTRLLATVPRQPRPRLRDRLGRSVARRSQRIKWAAEQTVRTPFSTFSEAIRSLRLGIRDANAAACKVVMVTSALPNEGKSTIASCLAHFAASSGEKVLLIDFDPRRPALTHAYAQDAAGGLTELLSGQAPMRDLVRTFEPTTLQFMPASELSPLMGGSGDEKMREFLEWARKAYDLVVIDAPPLIPVADGRSLISLVDGVLFVVQWGKTSLDAVSAAGHHTPDLAGKLLGTVLTQINLRRARLYDIYSSGYDLRAYNAQGSKLRSQRRPAPAAPAS